MQHVSCHTFSKTAKKKINLLKNIYLLFLKNRLIFLKGQFFKDASQLICNVRKKRKKEKKRGQKRLIVLIFAMLTAEDILSNDIFHTMTYCNIKPITFTLHQK